MSMVDSELWISISEEEEEEEEEEDKKKVLLLTIDVGKRERKSAVFCYDEMGFEE